MDTRETQKDNSDRLIKDIAIPRLSRAILSKTEKLMSAMYLVTGLMDSREAIRWELRSLSLSCAMGLENIPEKIYKIIFLLDTAMTGSLISEMNHSILKLEYSKLKEALSKLNFINEASSLVLSEHSFGPDVDSAQESVYLKDIAIKDSRGMSFIKNNGVSDIHRQVNSAGATLRSAQVDTGANKSGRRDILLAIIKAGREYTIKDIVAEVASTYPNIDCSEKTIQRDLLSLVALGTVAKSGERRWSRYARH